MAKVNSITRRKPEKPYPDFPLYASNNGQWAKVINYKPIYFGVWADPRAALNLYFLEKEEWEAGRNPRLPADAQHTPLTVGRMVELCLESKAAKAASGEIQERMYKDYQQIGARMVRVWGKSRQVDGLRSPDFLKLRSDFAKTHKALASLKGDIRRVRVFFNFATSAGYLVHRPFYGEGFSVPSAKAMRREREQKPKKLVKAAHLRVLLETARQPLRAMILLGINCAFGNTDCALLPLRALDLEGGWVEFPRPKTGGFRRCPLWPETVAALKEWLERHPSEDELVFRTHHGNSWQDKKNTLLSAEFRKLCVEVKLPNPLPRFYDLRHTFVTVASQTETTKAIRVITGHIPSASDILAVSYDERPTVSDRRLKRVTDRVWRWYQRSASQATSKTGDEGGHVVPFVPRSAVS
jgi:integrase